MRELSSVEVKKVLRLEANVADLQKTIPELCSAHQAEIEGLRSSHQAEVEKLHSLHLVEIECKDAF